MTVKDDTKKSIFVVSSAEDDNNKFGTAFLVHKEGVAAYFLTCLHVVEDVGGFENVIVGSKPALVIASGMDYGLDIAILKVVDLNCGIPLQLYKSGKKEDCVTISGSKRIKNPVSYSIESVTGELTDSMILQSPIINEIFEGWLLKLDSNNFLEPGYSGSPVFHNKSGFVLAVVSHSQGDGNFGRAISIGAAEIVWKTIPKGEFLNEVPELFEDKLVSYLDIDYTPLRDLLANHEWEMADWLTRCLLFKITTNGVTRSVSSLHETFMKGSSNVAKKYVASKIQDNIDLSSVSNKTPKWLSDYMQDAINKYKLGGFFRGSLTISMIKKIPLLDLKTIDNLWLKYSDGKYGFSVQKKKWLELNTRIENRTDAASEFCNNVGWKYMNTSPAEMVHRLSYVYTGVLIGADHDMFMRAQICIDSSCPYQVGAFPCSVLTSCLVGGSRASINQIKALTTSTRQQHYTSLANALSAFSKRLEEAGIE